MDKFFVHVANSDGMLFFFSLAAIADPMIQWLADAIFVKSFLLSYRCFATPRTILLGFQRTLRQLDAQACSTVYAETSRLK